MQKTPVPEVSDCQLLYIHSFTKSHSPAGGVKTAACASPAILLSLQPVSG